MPDACSRLPWTFDPPEALRRWPVDRRVLLLHSGRLDRRWSRYSILTEPIGALVHRAGRSVWLGDPAACPVAAWSHRPFRDLRRVLRDRDALWIGHLSYDLGRSIERLPSLAVDDRDWPLLQIHRCPGWLVYDGLEGAWRAYGSWRDAPPPIDAWLPHDGDYHAGRPVANLSREAFEQRVARAIDYIHAGDVFEVNLAHRFTAAFHGSPRALYHNLAARCPAWYGAYLELFGDDAPHRAIASTSPELFLAVDEHGRVTTRPIKGTRPASAPSDELRRSAKDIAELNMVVDMLRNDLGRVCSYGTVRVENPRDIESHPGVHHGVATITGTLHENKSLIDLLRATLPGGSVTGAPKVRAMQIIDELEPVRRGPYCGAIGYVWGDTARFNIAIRTMLIETDDQGEGRVDYSVGGAIVADSEPGAEYQETLDKAASMVRALRPEAVAAT